MITDSYFIIYDIEGDRHTVNGDTERHFVMLTLYHKRYRITRLIKLRRR